MVGSVLALIAWIGAAQLVRPCPCDAGRLAELLIASARAAEAQPSIPIVFAGSSDPVAGGIARNLARPAGNVRGTSLAVGEAFAGKWLELLEEATPHLGRAAVLWSSSIPPARRFVEEIRKAARTLHVTVDVHHAATARAQGVTVPHSILLRARVID